MSEKTGYHRGSLETLLHEKKELSRLLKIVNSQIERHLQQMEEEGFNREDIMEQIKSGEVQEKQNWNNQSEGEQDSGTEENLLEDDSGDFGDRDFSPR